MFGIDDMAIAGGMSALANLGGGILGANSAQSINAQQMAMQRDANFANMSFARESLDNSNFQAHVQREFQWKMANTAYQRATADMRAAGLNPILAYQQGGAATTGGAAGSSPVGANQSGVSGLDNPGSHLSKGIAGAVASAVDAAKTVQGVKLMKEQAETQKTTQKLQEDQAKAAIAAAQRDEASAIASAAQAAKTTAETTQVVPAMANSYNASAASSSAQAAATTEDARRKREFGDTVVGQNLNTIQQIGKRLFGWLESRRATGEVPPPTSVRPGAAPLLQDDPTHWLYNPNRKR